MPKSLPETPGSPPVSVAIVKAPGTDDLPLPAYQTKSAAGLDLYAAVKNSIVVQAGERAAVPTGIHIALPEGYEAQVRPRSGLARSFGIGMVNSPGTIDADYRGEVQVLLINHGQEPFTINRGERIAQLVVAPVTRILWNEVRTLEETDRGSGGFGHTGTQG